MASKKRGRKSIANIRSDFEGNPVAEAAYIVSRIKKLNAEIEELVVCCSSDEVGYMVSVGLRASGADIGSPGEPTDDECAYLADELDSIPVDESPEEPTFETPDFGQFGIGEE